MESPKVPPSGLVFLPASTSPEPLSLPRMGGSPRPGTPPPSPDRILFSRVLSQVEDQGELGVLLLLVGGDSGNILPRAEIDALQNQERRRKSVGRTREGQGGKGDGAAAEAQMISAFISRHLTQPLSIRAEATSGPLVHQA